MKIVIVGTFPPYRGGLTHFNTILFQKLSICHDVYGVNFITQYPECLFPGETQYNKRRHTQLKHCDRLLSSINPLTWKTTSRAIISVEPELIIFKYWMPFFSPAFGSVVRMVKKKINTNVIVICDNVIPHEKHFYDNFLTLYFFSKVDSFIVMSRTVENDLLSLCPKSNFRYAVHPIYDIFGEELAKGEARKRLGLATKNVILYFGLVRPYKGLDILINAAKRLRSTMNDFVILAVGECYEDPEQYRRLITENDVVDVVDLRFGFVPDSEVKTYFSAADVVVLPYRSATQSGVVQIAYHFNRPVIVTNVGGLPEIVPDGEVGFVIEPRSQAVAEAIERFFNENLLETFSKNLSKYKQRFSWDAMIKAIEELTRC